VYKGKKEGGMDLRVAIIGANFDERHMLAKQLSERHNLPLIAEQKDMFKRVLEGNGEFAKDMLNAQIRKQLLFRNGFVSDGCTLDYVVMTKIALELADKNTASVPDLLRARLHTVRQLDKVIYVPLSIHEEVELIRKYDAYLKAELNLISKRLQVQTSKTWAATAR
jgi:hypothetical protein